jgi:hypothetical protein
VLTECEAACHRSFPSLLARRHLFFPACSRRHFAWGGLDHPLIAPFPLRHGIISTMTDKPKNVFRIDIQPSDEHPDRHPTHGWQVRIKRQKKQHTKYFSDKRFGGREDALAKAVEYRDELLETLPDPMDPVRRSAEARSKTGVIGLNFCWKDDGSGTAKPYVQLSWLEGDGTRRSAAYSVRKWNLRRAVWKACVRLHQAREEHDGEVDEVNEMFQTAYPNIKEQYDEGPEGEGNSEEDVTATTGEPELAAADA